MSSSVVPKWMGPLDFHPGLVIIRIVVLRLRCKNSGKIKYNKKKRQKKQKNYLWWLKWNMGLVPFLFFCWYDLGIWFWSAKDGQATFMPAGPSQITRCLRVSENIGQATSQFSLTLAVVQPSVLPTPEPFAMWLGLTEQCWSDKNTCIMPNGHIPNETRRSDHQKGNWELSRWCSNTGNSVKKNEQTLTHPGCLNQSWL